MGPLGSKCRGDAGFVGELPQEARVGPRTQVIEGDTQADDVGLHAWHGPMQSKEASPA